MGIFDEAIVVFLSLLGPWRFMLMALSYLPGTIVELISLGQFGTIFSTSKLKDAWFSRFWAFFGREVRKGNGPRITALFEGRVTEGDVVDTPVVPPVGGVVLDIGPGPGYWVDLYAKAATGVSGENIKFRGRGSGGIQIYGVEPNPDAHVSLKNNVKAAGLENNYKILPVGIQSLSSAGIDKIEKGSVDCIVSLLCLCSIPEPEKNIAELYQYLKEGGRWYMYEHVKNKSCKPMTFYQAFVNLFWPHALGGCQLCRDTEKSLRQAGPWRSIDVHSPPAELWHQTVPHIFGTMTK